MPTLYLVPNSINGDDIFFSKTDVDRLLDVRLFFVEEPKAARRVLKSIDRNFPINDSRLLDLNEHTKPDTLKEYGGLLAKQDAGLICESGVPAVADPGSGLVAYAHQNAIQVVPIIGPSSIIMAMMSSGLNGQNFAFNGYLPKDLNERLKAIKGLQNKVIKDGQTQIMMEAPYRNQNIFEDLIQNLDGSLCLSVSCDITGPEEYIKTQTVKQWQKSNIQLPRKPALFIIGRL